MSLQDKIKKANVTDDHPVTLVFQDSTDVKHCFDDYHGWVVEESPLVPAVAAVVTDPAFEDNTIIQEMRDGGYLEGYSENPTDVAEVLKEHGYSDGNWIGMDLDQWDYKWGEVTLTTQVETTVSQVLSANPDSLNGWTATLETELGELKLES